ncbi:MAG: hypothetical protein IJJ47_08145 [Methanosphaera sp.]|nr:hypothetical protein [Methanosphaera sp.]
MYYLIDETLIECSREDLAFDKQFVAILTPNEWSLEKESFDMGFEFDVNFKRILVTEAVTNYDSITGTFCIPDRKDFENDFKFAFALDEKGIVFIDEGDTAEKYINRFKNRKKRFPCLERFIYDFLIQIVKRDLNLMERYERELDTIEDKIELDEEFNLSRMNEIRTDVGDLSNHYEQLIDMTEVFESNENDFFKDTNLRYFRLYLNKLDRLNDKTTFIREYTKQIRDIYRTHIDIKQNRTITVLTIVTTICSPLTLIVGWYGMNFRHMPELDYSWSYPLVFITSLMIVICSLVYFRMKKII